MADANDSKSFGSDTMPVQVRPRGPFLFGRQLSFFYFAKDYTFAPI